MCLKQGHQPSPSHHHVYKQNDFFGGMNHPVIDVYKTNIVKPFITIRWLRNSIRSSKWLPIEYGIFLGNMNTPSSLQTYRSLGTIGCCVAELTKSLALGALSAASGAGTAGTPRSGCQQALRGKVEAPRDLKQGRKQVGTLCWGSIS